MDNSFDFTPGTMVSYSSTNFVTAGLILINHGTAPISASTWETMKTDTFLYVRVRVRVRVRVMTMKTDTFVYVHHHVIIYHKSC